MVTGFERIIISVPEIGEAADEYRNLMGVEPFPAELSDAGKVLWFDLGNTVVQLQRGFIGEAAITGIVFSVPSIAMRRRSNAWPTRPLSRVLRTSSRRFTCLS